MQKLLSSLYGYLSLPNAQLGNRLEYVGSSDVGNCPRKCVLGKLNPVKPDLSSLIRFARGHAVEKMVRDALVWNDVKHHYQLEASHPKKPFKVHVDFTFENRPVSQIHVFPADLYKLRNCSRSNSNCNKG